MAKTVVLSRLHHTVSLLDDSSLDRKKLAERLDVSDTSARSIADFLTSNMIASEYKKRNGTLGRNSSTLYLRSDPIFAVADIYRDRIITTLFGYSLTTVHSYTHEFDDLLFLDDGYTSYFRNLIRMYPALCSICIMQNEYHGNCPASEENELIRILDIATEHLGDVRITIENKALWISEDTKVLTSVISESKGELTFSLVYKNELISDSGRISGSIGNIDIFGRSLRNKLRYSDSSEDYVTTLSYLFNCMIILTNVGSIYFTTDRYSDVSMILQRIKEKLIV